MLLGSLDKHSTSCGFLHPISPNLPPFSTLDVYSIFSTARLLRWFPLTRSVSLIYLHRVPSITDRYAIRLGSMSDFRWMSRAKKEVATSTLLAYKSVQSPLINWYYGKADQDRSFHLYVQNMSEGYLFNIKVLSYLICRDYGSSFFEGSLMVCVTYDSDNSGFSNNLTSPIPDRNWFSFKMEGYVFGCSRKGDIRTNNLKPEGQRSISHHRAPKTPIISLAKLSSIIRKIDQNAFTVKKSGIMAFCDLHFVEMKKLHINYTYGGNQLEVEVNDLQELILPQEKQKM
ncbi:unnamed protein product [Lactuca virosa]|uniref:DnaJ-like protein C11 C-terminal domain-containing protein n=1 Tax=Lactuca virosa TaxID=75947 RepID=A0AAU9MN66_9ASTR|nr:unnamed protein product [Lactuca virosa]